MNLNAHFYSIQILQENNRGVYKTRGFCHSELDSESPDPFKAI
jgi:hypothetical protein